VAVFFVEFARFLRQSADGVGDLVAGPEHLEVEMLASPALGAQGGGVELLSSLGNFGLASAEDPFPVGTLVEVNALGIRRVLVRVSGPRRVGAGGIVGRGG
jgi:hypothetical protein